MSAAGKDPGVSFSTWADGHKRSLLFLLAVIAMVGAFAALRLPSSLFPAVDFPRVVVSLDAGDQPAEQMEVLVTRPVEQAIRRVPGVTNVRSVTSRGSAEVSVSFDWGIDMASATLQVNAATAQVIPQLPAGTVLKTRRMDPTVFPIIAYSLTSPSVSAADLRALADYTIGPQLSSVPGVAHTDAIGGAVEEYHVIIDPMRLQAYGLTLDDVSRTLAAANVVSAVGRLEDRYKLLLVLADTTVHTLGDLGETVISHGPNGMVRLADVASLQRAAVPQWTRVTADGTDAVLVQIYQQPGSNSVQIATDVKARLAALRPQLPPGIRIANWYDQSDLVSASAASVRDAILIGAGLAAGVLLLFLRNWKVTLIAVAVVPTVLATTVVVLGVLGLSFNVMTLGGMAAAVGLIIDDAIVMTEHIVRRLRERGGGASGTVREAATEFMRPLAGSSAATLVIFAPLAFLTGVTGAFFKALSITMAGGLLISFVVTAVGVPLLASAFLGDKDAQQREGGRLTDALKVRYDRLMTRLLRRPAWVFAGVVPLALLGGYAFTQVGSGFMPAIDEGGFVLDYRSPPGTALSETDRLLKQVEAIVQATPDVQTFSRRTGTGLGGGLSEANSGDFFIRLKSTGRRPVDVVMDDIRSRVEHQVPGLSIEMAQLMEDLIGDLTAVPQPVEIKLFSDHPAQLATLAPRIAQRLGKVAGVVDVRDGINLAGDALQIHVDRVKAAIEGVDPAVVAKLAGDVLSGNVATQVLDGIKTIGVRVWVPRELRQTADGVASLVLHAPDGHAFALGRVATVEAISGQPEIGTENLKRMVAVTARISGRDLGSVMTDVQAMLAPAGVVPAGVTWELGGLYSQQQIAFKGLMQVFGAAAALVFLLLLFMYESFAMALAIMATSLLAVSAVFIGLWITGIELNITAMMGMTMIIGIVTEVGIFFFSEQREVAPGLAFGEALSRAGQNRMRPIAMTTIAAILTLLPLAFALGRGAEMQQPLAVAIISGLVVQLPLVLLAMPAFYALMSPRSRRAPER
ncbi:MAG: efflux RND transporter permease subunit, partial [Pseudomonadota bacterium]|nr:efflux RND transporter permease subunit [Pseudomonadota bacterium]